MATGGPHERLGCVCVLFITEGGGTQPGTCVIGCLEHKRVARDNHLPEA